ncbi:MAG: tetratricopeptide repeat protein, partial [Bacteroidota bacterium]
MNWFRNILVFLFLLFFSIEGGLAQSADSWKAEDHYKIAVEYQEDLRYDEAIIHFQKASQMFKQSSSWEDYLDAQYKIGFIYWRIEKHDEARVLFADAMDVCRETLGIRSLAWALLNRGRGVVAEYSEPYEVALKDKYGYSQISVSLQCHNEQASIIVEDDGNGIAKEQWQSIFVPFSRLDESRSKNGGGYGLGLAIVRK